MRPQQNRRMRGRGGGGNNNNNNRKGPNPLTRSYESNGPDVKIRGTAQQIAEKYSTLARDAQSSGDRVMAENYLQHAEHYNRIIAAAQAQMPNQQPRPRDDEDDEDEERDAQPNYGSGEQQPAPSFNGNGAHLRTDDAPQPVIEGTPAEVALEQGELESRRQSQPRDQAAAPAQEAGERSEGDGGQPPRRARRPRRPRNRVEDEGDSQPADEPAPAA